MDVMSPYVMSPLDSAELEKLVDRVGLSAVLESLAEIASEKAEHVRANWQDRDLARTWDRVSRRVSSLALNVDV